MKNFKLEYFSFVNDVIKFRNLIVFHCMLLQEASYFLLNYLPRFQNNFKPSNFKHTQDTSNVSIKIQI